MNHHHRDRFACVGNLHLFFVIVIVSVAFSAQSGFSAFEFTAPATLNTNADTDSGVDWDPQITTDDSGNWVAVWRSDEDLGGTAGTDADIFVSTSMFTPVNSWQLY